MKRVEHSKQGRQRKRTSADFAKFHNPKVLREILGSRPDVDWVNAPLVRLLEEKIKHPEFSGTVAQLFKKAFGLRKAPGGKGLPKTDLRMLLWLAMEDEMIEKDERKLERSGAALKQEDMMPDKKLEIQNFLDGMVARTGRYEFRIWAESHFSDLPIEHTPAFRLEARRLAHVLNQTDGPRTDYGVVVRRLLGRG